MTVEIIQPLHAVSVRGNMELLGVMVTVYGLMNNVFLNVMLPLHVTVMGLVRQITHASVMRDLKALIAQVSLYQCNFFYFFITIYCSISTRLKIRL